MYFGHIYSTCLLPLISFICAQTAHRFKLQILARILKNVATSNIVQSKYYYTICGIVCIVVSFLMGNSPESEFYMPTFRNILSVVSSWAGWYEE